MEATGNYWMALANWAYAKKWHISVINPLQIKAYAKSIGQRSKTDKLDAFLLARFGEKEHPQYWQPKQEAQQILEMLIRQLEHISERLAAERSRLQTVHPIIREHVRKSVEFLKQEQ
ncbi:Transposase [Suttonella ornithocola]|uniref:Transposase n=1 Tax=Suttonella ornithocola TaxID=279832 RepID=A0A380MM00_9GAMM|nr:Transposase [Suttonella ornithocola]